MYDINIIKCWIAECWLILKCHDSFSQHGIPGTFVGDKVESVPKNTIFEMSPFLLFWEVMMKQTDRLADKLKQMRNGWVKNLDPYRSFNLLPILMNGVPRLGTYLLNNVSKRICNKR